MPKTDVMDIAGSHTSLRLSLVSSRLVKLAENIRSFFHLSDDMLYKRHFIKEYIPTIYRKHTSQMQENCVYCMHLVRSGCHRHCLKCALGKYEQCSPLLPDLINTASIYPYDGEKLRIPWYYTESCSSFSRLPQDNYLRNFNTIFSSASIYNYEILESLESGLLSGERPCHVCAAIDYDIYKKCYGQGDFNTFSPCRKIIDELADFYQNRNEEIIANKEAS